MSREITTIDIGTALGIAQVAELHARLVMAHNEAGKLRIDISGLQRVDAAAMQLLYGFQRDAMLEGDCVSWTKPSESFREAASRLGMNGCFPFLVEGW